MRLLQSTGAALLLVLTPTLTYATSSWGFSDASVSVQSKGQGVGGGTKEKLSEKVSLSKSIELGVSDTLKIILTAKEGSNAKRPHQTFLSITDSKTGLETSFPFSVKESGKGKLDITHKDIPTQLLQASGPLSASLVIASFGGGSPYSSKAFDLAIRTDLAAPPVVAEKPLRYGKLPEIHHIFKADPRSPPKIISLFFTGSVVAGLGALFVGWLTLGANLNHLSTALNSAPLSHTLYFGSIVAMEAVFFMYYTSWNLFQTLPAAGAISAVIFLSGSRALTEVQERRLAGLRG